MENDTQSESFQQQAHTVSEAAATPMQDQAAQPAAADNEVDSHKLLAVLGYILPILFFLPLVLDGSKNNAFARFHANQQLLLLIAGVGVYAIHNVLFIMLMAGGYFLIMLLNLAILVLAIMGVINAVQGHMKELPVIGQFRLLK